jgi:hypothetical protein
MSCGAPWQVQLLAEALWADLDASRAPFFRKVRMRPGLSQVGRTVGSLGYKSQATTQGTVQESLKMQGYQGIFCPKIWPFSVEGVQTLHP